MSDWRFNEELDNLDDDEEMAESDFQLTRDSTIFLIDCSESMFLPYAQNQQDASDAPDGIDSSSANSHTEEPAFILALRSCRTFICNKVFTSEKDLIGVVLFGVQNTNNPGDFKQISILQELDMPDAERILALDHIIENLNDIDKLKQEVGGVGASNFSLSDALWTCSDMFAKNSVKLSDRRILIFTREDAPHGADPQKNKQAKIKAHDLWEQGIVIDLLHMMPINGRKFSEDFYQDIVYSEDGESGEITEAADKFDELLTRVRCKQYKKRALQRTVLTLGGELELGIGMYTMVRVATKPSFKWLDKETNQEVKTQTRKLCVDTGQELSDIDIKYYQSFGGVKAIFEKDEVSGLKDFGLSQGFKLLGFKPISHMKLYHHIRPSNFIYPDEDTIKGSKKLFAALLDRCLTREKMIICYFSGRGSSPPRLVALLPQAEEKDEAGIQTSPPGFNMVYFPFADDLRKLVYEPVETPLTYQVDAAKEVIKKCRIKFSSDNFENPSLQNYYRHLEALALEKEEPEPVVDLTEPNVDKINKRAGDVIDNFLKLVYPNGQPSDSSSSAVKSKRKTDDAGTSSKRAKVTDTDSDGKLDYKTMAETKTLSKLTIAELKNFLQSIGDKAAGKKSVLIESIEKHFGIS